jgi:hypothetical protein
MTPAYVSVKRWRNPMDDPFISQLRQLSPTVDAMGSKTVLDRRLKRSRTRRRTLGAGFGAAGLALATFTVTQIADQPSNDITIVGAPEPDEPLTVRPNTTQAASTNPTLTAQPQPASDVPFEVLSDAQFTSDVDLLDAVDDGSAFPGWWTGLGPLAATPVVDFSRSVVVAFTVANPSGSACSVIVGFTAEKSADGSILSLTPNIADRPGACRLSFVPKRSFVVSIDRAAVMPGFTLSLPASTDPAFDERALFVNVSGGQLATPPEPISVSYGDDTPIFEPTPFATVEVAATADSYGYEIAVGSGQVVVVDRQAKTATLVDSSLGTTRSIALDVAPGSIVLGPPGDVLYGFTGDGPNNFAMSAIALDGPRAGEVISSNPLPINTFMELPIGATGHGPSGIIERTNRRPESETLIDYSSADGSPVPPSGPWLQLEHSEIASNEDGDQLQTIQALDGSSRWGIQWTPAPNAAGSYTGEMPPAPTAEGGAVVFRYIGPQLEPQADFGTPTGPVVAVLRPDGSGKWYRLPEGWRVAASDVWGTVLARNVEGAVELAWLKVDGVQSPSK